MDPTQLVLIACAGTVGAANVRHPPTITCRCVDNSLHGLVVSWHAVTFWNFGYTSDQRPLPLNSPVASS